MPKHIGQALEYLLGGFLFNYKSLKLCLAKDPYGML